MGELFMADKDKWFANRQDRLHKQHFESADLLTATEDRKEIKYQFKSDKTDLKMSASVMFVDDGHPCISVFRGMRRIGFLDSGSSADLQKLFGDHPALGKSIKANICEDKDWAGNYSAKISHSKH